MVLGANKKKNVMRAPMALNHANLLRDHLESKIIDELYKKQTKNVNLVRFYRHTFYLDTE